MTSSSKRKGARAELSIVAAHTALGVAAKKLPLSGALGGEYAGDVMIDGIGRGEVKARRAGAGFATIERWLGENDVLFLKRAYGDVLVVLPWSTYARIIGVTR